MHATSEVSPAHAAIDYMDGHLNRRRSYRTPCGLKAQLCLADDPPLPGVRLKNISREGMGLYSWEPIQPGRVVSIRIPDLNPDSPLGGEVRRCHQTRAGRYEVGVAFHGDQFHRYKSTYDDLWEVECYRRTIEQVDDRPVSSEAALTRWRRKFSRRRGGA